VVTAVKTDTFNTTSTTAVDVPDVSVNITPTSTSSKIFIQISGNATNANNTSRTHLILAGTTSQSIGDAGTGVECTTTICTRASDDNYTQDSFSITFLDSPASTSQQTYKLQVLNAAGGAHAYINRPATQDDNGGNCITTITAMEILP